jgi:DNA-binding GntR family transcriptional regulator
MRDMRESPLRKSPSGLTKHARARAGARSPGRRQDSEPSAVAQAVEALYSGIRQGRFAAGQRLIEAELTTNLGVSRSSLREAFLRLAADGMIEIIRNRGAVVRQLGRQEVRELMQIRQALEGLAASLAAQRIRDGADTGGIKAVSKFWLGDISNLETEQFIQENSRFHRAIIEASGNRQLQAQIERLHLPLFTYQFRNRLSREAMRAAAEQHRTISSAILAGNAAAARSAMASHIAQTQKIIDQLFADP